MNELSTVLQSYPKFKDQVKYCNEVRGEEGKVTRINFQASGIYYPTITPEALIGYVVDRGMANTSLGMLNVAWKDDGDVKFSCGSTFLDCTTTEDSLLALLSGFTQWVAYLETEARVVARTLDGGPICVMYRSENTSDDVAYRNLILPLILGDDVEITSLHHTAYLQAIES